MVNATGELWIEDKTRVEEYAWDRLGKEIEDSMQSLEYEVQTLMTSRAETPFLTLGINNVNGIGFRTSLSVSGCAKNPPCRGCFSPEAKQFD